MKKSKKILQNKAIQQEEEDAEYSAANASLNGFFRANLRTKLVSAEEIPCKIRHNIGYPSTDKGQKKEICAILQAAQKRQRGKADDNVDGADRQLCQKRKSLVIAREDANGKIVHYQKEGSNGNKANVGSRIFTPEEMRQKRQCKRI